MHFLPTDHVMRVRDWERECSEPSAVYRDWEGEGAVGGGSQRKAEKKKRTEKKKERTERTAHNLEFFFSEVLNSLFSAYLQTC